MSKVEELNAFMRAEEEEMEKTRLEGLERKAEAAFRQKQSTAKWPFCFMKVGECKFFMKDGSGRARRAQEYCHVYGYNAGKKFQTKTILMDGQKYLAVKRVA